MKLSGGCTASGVIDVDDDSTPLVQDRRETLICVVGVDGKVKDMDASEGNLER